MSRSIRSGTLNEHGDGLERMTHDPFWLGVIGGFLMELLDPWHAFTLMWALGAISNADYAGVDYNRAEQPKAQADPVFSELTEFEGLTVKQVEESVISGWTQTKDTDKACDASEVRATGKSHQCKNHP